MRARFTRCHVIVESDACSYVEQSMRIWRYAQGLLRTMPHKAAVAIIRPLRPWARRARTRLHQPARTGRSPRPSLGPPLERPLYFAPTRTIGEAAGGDRADAELDAHGGMLADKYQYHQPLYRIHQRLEGAGFTLSRPWLTQLSQQAIALLEPIYRKRCVRDVVYVDGAVCKADRSGAAAKCCFHRRGVSSATRLAGWRLTRCSTSSG